MSSRVRVANKIDEGYNFDVEHKNWILELTWKEKFLLLLITFLPTVVINIAYLLFRDILLSQMLFQLTMIILPVIYNQFYPLNLDILYIQYVKNIPHQIKRGIFMLLFYLIVIPGVAILLRYFEIDILEGMILMIPSGLTPESKFQFGVHVLYFIFLGVVFGVMAPIAEFRYYLVFLQSKFNDNTFSYIVMFLLFTLNGGIVMIYMVQYAKINFVYLFIVLVVVSNYRLLKFKSEGGIIVTLLRQVGINFGVIILMILSIYTSSIIKKRRDISLFIDKNAFDLMVDGFIWDDPNYDSSF